MDLPANTIFICYRRDDSADVTGRLYDRLETAFPSGAVFRDVDTIPLGADFRKHVGAVLSGCQIVLVVIGPGWLTAKGNKGGQRLADPRDHVRIEIEHALARQDICVIPVLVGGARMPDPDALPKSLEDLAFRNAADVRRDPDFRSDADRLIRHVKEMLETNPPAPPPVLAPSLQPRAVPEAAPVVRPEVTVHPTPTARPPSGSCPTASEPCGESGSQPLSSAAARLLRLAVDHRHRLYGALGLISFAFTLSWILPHTLDTINGRVLYVQSPMGWLHLYAPSVLGWLTLIAFTVFALRQHVAAVRRNVPLSNPCWRALAALCLSSMLIMLLLDMVEDIDFFVEANELGASFAYLVLGLLAIWLGRHRRPPAPPAPTFARRVWRFAPRFLLRAGLIGILLISFELLLEFWEDTRGFSWNRYMSSVSLEGSSETLDPFLPLLQRLSPRHLTFHRAPRLRDLSALKNVPPPQSISIGGCEELRSLKGIETFTGLKELHVYSCPALRSLAPLKELTSLQMLTLSHCPALEGFESLSGLKGLTDLDLKGSDSLKNLDPLKGLSALRVLDVSFCESLTNIDGIKMLKDLQILDLRECSELSSAALSNIKSDLPNTRIAFPARSPAH